MKKIGFIPARGGSKGVPRKNLRIMAGQPMFTYSLLAGLQSSLDSVVVSSDDSEILETASTWTARFAPSFAHKLSLHVRPPAISGDRSTIDEAVAHFAAERLAADELLVLLPPTSPLRTSAHVEGACSAFEQGNMRALVSVSEPMEHPGDMAAIEDGVFHFILERGEATARQEYAKCCFINGALYLMRLADYLKEKTFFLPSTKMYVMDQLSSIDVDTEADFIIAESLLMCRGKNHARIS